MSLFVISRHHISLGTYSAKSYILGTEPPNYHSTACTPNGTTGCGKPVRSSGRSVRKLFFVELNENSYHSSKTLVSIEPPCIFRKISHIQSGDKNIKYSGIFIPLHFLKKISKQYLWEKIFKQYL
ncbi:hypothetical protein HHI36_020027 [Cryptolaemus montrouzieri]|uniref:Uncharacterized protein n=1 Tax=Cryptolaemus montrouzieri TaxID=559131 RepID=A0ABD2N9E1_9CUCU